MSNNQNKPRFREIVEGATGNVIGAIILAILGFATGGLTIGWLPTLVVSGMVVGIFFLWYRYDPSLQGLIRQRFFKIKHAVTSQSVVMSRWNLITEETINHIVRQNKLIRDHVNIEQSRIIKFNNQDHLELVLSYLSDIKYLSLTNSSGTIIDSYGGFKAISATCENCNAAIIVKYVKGKNGKPAAEPVTICRRCNTQMKLSVIDLSQQSEFNIKIKSIDKHNIEIKDGHVCLYIEFTIQNLGQATQVRPHLELKIAVKEGVGHVERIAQKDLSPIEIQGYSQKVKSLEWIFPITTVILTQKDGWLLIKLNPC
jgi:hypothetical protein